MSAVASAAYTITPSGGNNFMPPAATPTFSLAAGVYNSERIVTIGDTTTGATIYYTTDGSVPTTSSAQCTGAIKVSASETLKAVAIAKGNSLSAVASIRYTIQLASIVHGPPRPVAR